MKYTALITLFIISLFSLSCENITDPENNNGNAFGTITFIISNPHYFEGTDKICYSLTNENNIAIKDTIVVVESSGQLQIVMNNLKIGDWMLKVSALNNGENIYTEGLGATVEKDIKKLLELKWGNNAGKAASFDGNFSFVEIKNSESINSIKNQFTLSKSSLNFNLLHSYNLIQSILLDHLKLTLIQFTFP